jgi:hypothetical protein
MNTDQSKFIAPVGVGRGVTATGCPPHRRAISDSQTEEISCGSKTGGEVEGSIHREMPHDNIVAYFERSVTKRFHLYTCVSEAVNCGELNGCCDSRAQQCLVQYLRKQFPTNCPDDNLLDTVVTEFLKKFRSRWQKAKRVAHRFEQANSSWLDKEISIPPRSSSGVETSTTHKLPCATYGRPYVLFEQASERTKRRRTAELRHQHSSLTLLRSASSALRSEGKVKVSLAVSAAAFPYQQYSPSEALALLLDTGMTKSAYQLLRTQAKGRGCDLYPKYHELLQEKKACYPEGINVGPLSAEVPLQNLVDHTTLRLCFSLNLRESNLPSNISRMSLRWKWGFDGATGQSLYKQLTGSKRNLAAEESLFVTSCVPLQLVGFTDLQEKEKVLWTNPRPSSTMYCRPIKFRFEKETRQVIRNEEQNVQRDIDNLHVTPASDHAPVPTSHLFHLTMIDGKVLTSLSDETNSAQCCALCGTTPKEMNNISKMGSLSLTCASSCNYGLSSLHCWIRCFECLLHIAYKLPFKKYQARGAELKERKQAEKSRIQEEFANAIGLIVDHPLSGGSGSTNDGNTARRFFANPEISAEILRIDVDLISRFGTILSCISSGLSIDSQKFRDYCLETAEKFVHLFPWYYMPQSIHKLLIHGHVIIDSMSLPIGMMSEEAQECRNKDFKYFREHHSRKVSREKSNEDVFHRLLVTSDPLLSSMRCQRKPKTIKLTESMKSLLKVIDGKSEYADEACSDVDAS